MNTAEFLKSRNSKTIWLKEEEVDFNGQKIMQVREYAEEVEGGVPFKIKRISLNDVSRWALDVALEMPEVAVAMEHATSANSDLQEYMKDEIPPPRPNIHEGDSDYRRIPTVRNLVVGEAFLQQGMVEPKYEEVFQDLGPYKAALRDAIATFSTRVVDDPKR